MSVSVDCRGERHEPCVVCECVCHGVELDDVDVHGLAGLGAGLLAVLGLVSFLVLVAAVAAVFVWVTS